MNCFSKLKALQSSLRFAFFGCWLYLPAALWSQSTALLARQSVGLSVPDSIFVQKSLQLIPSDTYAYIVVHGSGKTFKCLEGNLWNSISDGSLANRIASNRAFDGKTIILLSCGDTTATQNLANALASLDNSATPKRALRSIIGWDGEVAIYSNGFIEGTGRCRKFAPTPSTPATILTGVNVPKGSGNAPTVGMASVLLMNQEGYEIGKLISDKTQAAAIRLAWRTYKFNFVANANNSSLVTDGEINNPAFFKSWLYLRVTAGSDTKLTGDTQFMLDLFKILNKGFYGKNGSGTWSPLRQSLSVTVQQAILDCVVAGSAKKITIEKVALLPETALPQTIIDIIEKAGIEVTLEAYLKNIFQINVNGTIQQYPIPLSLSPFDKNMLILEEKLPAFADILNDYIRMKTPRLIPNLPKSEGLTTALLDDLVLELSKDIVGKTAMLKDARNAITNKVNQTIGEHSTVTYDHFIKLTRMKDAANGIVEGLMNPDRSQNSLKGNIFEYWGTKAINRMTPFPLFTLPNTNPPTPPIVLQRKNPTELNNIQNNPKNVDVDGYFKIPAVPPLVAVEFKHAQEIPTDQLMERSVISKLVLNYFVYVFAEFIPDAKNPTVFSLSIVNKIRNNLGLNTEIYYFSTTNALVSLVKVP